MICLKSSMFSPLKLNIANLCELKVKNNFLIFLKKCVISKKSYRSRFFLHTLNN